MIKDIEIKNFRCFSKLKASGFAKVNLISGKNNAGKTALLEALFLNSSPRPDTIMFLRQLRRETSSFSESIPERTWNNLFFNQDKSSQLSIETISIGDYSKSLELSVDESVNNIMQNINLAEDDEILSSSNDSVLSVLHLRTKTNQGENYETSMISSSKGLINKDIKLPDAKNSFFIPSSLRLSNKSLTKEYDIARFNKKDAEILKAFQIIDPSIIEVDSFSIGEPTIYLIRANEERLPLSLFGDAVSRIADIILRLVNNENSILLIDEIENGIHYTNHESFWDILFRLAEALKVQIFCTTHSLEMMQAFVKAGKNYENSGAHFELARKAKSGNIVAIRRDLETLGYGIEHHKGVRGE